MAYYPIFIQGSAFHVLVVGGGTVAEGKIRSLVDTGAQVTLVSPEITPGIAALAEAGAITFLRECYHSGHIPFPVHLVIGATNDNEVNERIARDAGERGILVNIVDVTELCSVIMPSLMQRGPLSVAVSTSGAAPMLARKLRLEIEESIPGGYSLLIDELAALRPRIKQLPAQNRKAFWNTLSAFDKNALPKGEAAIREFARALLETHEKAADALAGASPAKTGKVYLVGAGPGDPLLLTLRGKQCLEQADVVVYDYLANHALLGYAPNSAEKLYVGKSALRHSKEQEEINQLIGEHSLAGKTVVRLKGGDPFLFGRGGEECEALKAHGIPFEVVPGITAGLGASAYAGIPLTHRTLSSSVAFVTGHCMTGGSRAPIHWEHLAKGVDTLVFYMGVANAAHISQELIQHGRAADTPAAFIEWATKPNQRTVVTTLGTLAETCEKEQVKPPALIVVGEAVRLRERLQWFE
ncbi:MAG: siroheme synthase CysG [Verrucomicrobiota bacterium]